MTNDEEFLKQKLARWRVEELPAGLIDRIVAHATALPQRRKFAQRLGPVLEDFFTQWRYGLSYKLASFALVAVLGFAAGALPLQEARQVDVTEIAFAQGGIMGGM